MKAFGRRTGPRVSRLLELREATIVADASTLRRLAEFLLYCADKMDEHGDGFGHLHFEDFARMEKPEVAFIVMRESNERE